MRPFTEEKILNRRSARLCRSERDSPMPWVDLSELREEKPIS
jgi:hypothetical protein